MTDTTTTIADAATPAPSDRPWLDASLPVEERVELLLAEMTVEEKAGLFFQTMIVMGEGGELSEGDSAFGIPSNREYVAGRHMNHFNLLGVAPKASHIAAWHNKLQELAASTRLGIPVSISTDPRHSFSDNPGAAMFAGPFSQWPEPLGLAATRDADLVQRFGDIARQEYTAVGIRVALHPQVDLATESRWARQLQTFGEDAALAGELGAAYVRGFQGSAFGPGSVSTMTKHFPGGGPQKDGEDPHFDYGREQVYPGGQFELHLKPFEEIFAAGGRQIMPYYGMPVGTEYEEVGFGFNKGVLTGLLRERFGFDGIVCTDWGLVTDQPIMGTDFAARAWGVEHLTPAERMVKILDAGADQFGGEHDPELLLGLVRDGRVSEERLDVSARRLLREKFELGLFENPYVDVEAADAIVGSAEFRAAGEAAQRASIAVLSNDQALPLRRGLKLYVEGIAPEAAAHYGEIVETPEEADAAILRLQAPYEQRASMFENFFHAGSLDFPEDVVAHVRAVSEVVPTVVDVFLDRPAILGPIVDAAAAVTANWGANADALLDVLTGGSPATGKLPFDVPSSMAAVEASRPDVPFDTADPLFRFGHGLSL
ncbi:glycoside hydrolase family 3 N-terminal domain-containing protein [Microbacterium sp. PRC9]|uniref:glycoside hydrolase family 3 protein n=1 Tax=Microbacterium sp. PRC9 TaxID=2962591 RepID=UPI00288206BA|nr:glycoside hydrolase family 3 N-terminal domain-containing protein [Microbacterium sp. PRC9]MDT0142286.1 glycoside hydrolase family 3 N-terminal domain-containing protein [Microbacterium sp. PRC9]